jgi:glycine cleavage system aminomethyltransferase T/glycine/D-amino acid oxidase-like deaminating enzyme
MDEARVVVIGGGVGGTSIAYHLAELGWTEVVLLERSELTSGSTFHSAGLVGQLRSGVTLTRMMMYGVELYRRLLDETGVDPSWHEVGSLRLASSTERMQELQRLAGWGQTFGLPLEIVSTERALELFGGLFDPAGVLGAAYLPTDGYLDPSGLTMALAAGARARGVTIVTGERVTGIDIGGGRVRGVELEHGRRIETKVVVNAGGIYANQIGRMAGVEVPVVPFAHQYVFTAPLEGVRADLPTMRDPDRLVYFRPEAGGGLVMGGYERDPAPWSVFDPPPADFNSRLVPEDWPRFEPLAEAAFDLVPPMQEAEIVRLINGPEAFTPDGEFLLGESDVAGFFVAAGFCAHGIAGAGGVGKVIAEWIVEGEPEYDVWKMDVRRFGDHYRSRRYALARATEVYATYYDIHYPNEERSAGRPLKTSPAYGALRELGAEFGEKSGWERANWFRSNEDEGLEDLRPRGWAGRHWSTAIVAEVRATRERVGLFDESSFAKLEVSGPGAAGFLQRICANDVARDVGRVVYSQLLNARGGIESDLTVTRLSDDRFRLVIGTAFGSHDLAWIRKQLARGGETDVIVRDVTGSIACFGVWGPEARDTLAAVTGDDLSFGYLRAAPVAIGHVPCLAVRVTYVGELGWELYAPVELGAGLWSTLLEAVRGVGGTACGYRAIDAMRLEKGYRAWGSDITPEDTPLEAGLGFAVAMGKPEFVGKEALEKQAANGLERCLACLVLADPRASTLGNEPVFLDGGVVSRVTSGGIGYATGASIAFAYLHPDVALGTAVEVEVFGERIPAGVSASPIYDPAGERTRA